MTSDISALPGVKTVEEQPVRNPLDATCAVLVVGASRGLGLELTRQIAQRGAQVVATRRGERATGDLAALEEKHENIRTVALDVTDYVSIAMLATSSDVSFSHVIYNAGVFGPRVPLGQVRASHMEEVYKVNTVGLLCVVQAMLPYMTSRGNVLPVLAVVSSQMGSVHVNNTGGSYAYRASKAAANVVCKSLAIDLRSKAVVVLLHPGWVATDMNDGRGEISVQDSVAGMIGAIEATDGSIGFRFVDYKRELVPW